eukprot:COSAG05_NODE_13717_length_420_cov_0.800623_1_plen_66_part_00
MQDRKLVAGEAANRRNWQRAAAPGVMRALVAFGTPKSDWLHTLQHMPPQVKINLALLLALSLSGD